MRRTLTANEGASAYLIGICASSVVSLFMSLAFSRSAATFDGMSVYGWVAYAVTQVAFIVTVALFFKVRRASAVGIVRIRRPRSFWQFALTPFIAVATIMIFLPLANLWGSFLNIIGYNGPGVMMPDYSNVGVYFLSLLVMAILPAIGEEALMRGTVFSGLSTRNVWFGVLMSALFFSLMHANPLQTVHQFGLGASLALTIALTDSIFCAAAVHFFNNFISITLTAYLPEVDALYVTLGYFNWLTGAASVLCGLILLTALFYAMYRLGGGKGRTPRIEYEGFAIYAPDDSVKRRSAVKDYFAFLRSLFTKSGWVRLTRELTSQNGVELVSSKGYNGVDEKSLPVIRRPLFGVWIALALVTIYWLYAFISGLI